MNMKFATNKLPLEVIEEEHLKKPILVIFILVLMLNHTEKCGKN